MRHVLVSCLTMALAAPLTVGVAISAEKTIKSTTMGKLKKAPLHTSPPGGATTTTGGNTVSELTSWDCKAVGGAVVVVADDRCGKSGRYCRMPDTNAVCIEEASQ